MNYVCAFVLSGGLLTVLGQQGRDGVHVGLG
jgi:hypothetical protein